MQLRKGREGVEAKPQWGHMLTRGRSSFCQFYAEILHVLPTDDGTGSPLPGSAIPTVGHWGGLGLGLGLRIGLGLGLGLGLGVRVRVGYG